MNYDIILIEKKNLIWDGVTLGHPIVIYKRFVIKSTTVKETSN